MLKFSQDVWKKYYEAYYGQDPYNILASYQHLIAFPLYTPDYALGYIISHQVRSFIRGQDLAKETKRITSLGSVTPQLWMQKAVGENISVSPLISDAEKAMKALL